jgi:hypothetical protein
MQQEFFHVVISLTVFVCNRSKTGKGGVAMSLTAVLYAPFVYAFTPLAEITQFRVPT